MEELYQPTCTLIEFSATKLGPTFSQRSHCTLCQVRSQITAPPVLFATSSCAREGPLSGLNSSGPEFRVSLKRSQLPGQSQYVNGTSPLMVLHNWLKNTANSLSEWKKMLSSDARMQLLMVNEVILR